MAGWVRRPRVVRRSLQAIALLAALTGAASPRTRAEIEADIRQEADNDAAAGQRDVATALRVFAGEASQVGLLEREIMTIYQDEYRREIDRRKPGPWEAYRFQIMMVLAIVGFLAAILRKSIEDVLGKASGGCGERSLTAKRAAGCCAAGPSRSTGGS